MGLFLFAPLPARTISKSTDEDMRAMARVPGNIWRRSELFRPALAQNNQHSGWPAIFPSWIKHLEVGSCFPVSQRDTAMAE